MAIPGFEQESLFLIDGYSGICKPFIATKTKQRSRGNPTRPMHAAPKFRSMSSNFNRDKKVYKQGISRIGKRNEFYKRRYKGKNRRAREEFWNVMLP